MNVRKKSVNEQGKLSAYCLSDVTECIKKCRYSIKPDARRDAFQLFGWGEDDIIFIYNKLRTHNFLNTNLSRYKPGVFIDAYIIQIRQENIYTHFYIENGYLVINSFHQDDNFMGRSIL